MEATRCRHKSTLEFDPRDESTWPTVMRPDHVTAIDPQNQNEWYSKARTGKLPYRVIRDGRRVLIPRASFLAWIHGTSDQAA